jgi:hypothetical protein
MGTHLQIAQQQYRVLYYTPSETMDLLGVCRRTLERYVHKKRLTRYKQGRYTLYNKIEVQGIFAEMKMIREEGKEDEFAQQLKALSLRHTREKKSTRPTL